MTSFQQKVMDVLHSEIAKQPKPSAFSDYSDAVASLETGLATLYKISGHDLKSIGASDYKQRSFDVSLQFPSDKETPIENKLHIVIYDDPGIGFRMFDYSGAGEDVVFLPLTRASVDRVLQTIVEKAVAADILGGKDEKRLAAFDKGPASIMDRILGSNAPQTLGLERPLKGRLHTSTHS